VLIKKNIIPTNIKDYLDDIQPKLSDAIVISEKIDQVYREKNHDTGPS
tara:strand:+ start:26023 stop:26166 length:144 start_codon:yes stop_codon:yes gene_type:complete